MERWLWRPISVGVTAALVGFLSSFAVVLAGLSAVGATTAQATTGLIALCALMGAGTILLTLRHRTPLMLAWSTPGAAILVSAGAAEGGWPAAVGAFLVTGLMIVLTAALPALGRLVAAIPAPLAQAMLAGVLLTLCVQPVIAFAQTPLMVGPVLLAWVVLARFAPRWAAPVAFALALGIAVADVLARGEALVVASPLPTFTMPSFTFPALIGIALPLYIVTMASQNVPGAAIMASFDVAVPWRESLFLTGAGTMLGSPAGGHAINLAAITAALSASAEAHPDRRRRWIAAHAAGWAYLVLGALTPLLVVLAAAAPAGLIEAVAGLALLGTLASALSAAVAERSRQVAVVLTFVIAASPVVLLGIGPSLWSLVAGLIVWGLSAARPFRGPTGPSAVRAAARPRGRRPEGHGSPDPRG
ncbi:benzoate/H(+) symporter BenE family transporter [Microbacterium sp. No. 7]|uniref:benzoate/H(+) symporter BenE family transporter n=1 Tax=Microbacterium sp. No. 7 TaxID=1714373 RepID=UPI0009E6749D|nr:benzoate/H(+) symporter BenE family transporter [Microbacterium sp. No. 7]